MTDEPHSIKTFEALLLTFENKKLKQGKKYKIENINASYNRREDSEDMLDIDMPNGKLHLDHFAARAVIENLKRALSYCEPFGVFDYSDDNS